ncbi:hypothetical protein Q5H92_14520 [Hymenobacter sp. M29]|uniref:Uncharacterized protein n=1 Tax=Hymenobacter mellowenesis TaxID=3063995 RepID=A0ABT9AF23_9BACT|nr:hypothetical protein [Hymenobacter sp. M29]MDO7847581.1 hypothetical protein [Hymenobacter sp. M29]
MKQSFDNSVAILVKAYLNDTLWKGNCYGCAVGNLVAASCGYSLNKVDLDWGVHAQRWADVFVTTRHQGQELSPERYKGPAKEQIDSTGYTWKELAQVELAFETAYPGGYYDKPDHEQGMYQGLMAVVEVLATIHNIPLEQALEAKSLFVKA